MIFFSSLSVSISLLFSAFQTKVNNTLKCQNNAIQFKTHHTKNVNGIFYMKNRAEGGVEEDKECKVSRQNGKCRQFIHVSRNSISGIQQREEERVTIMFSCYKKNVLLEKVTS